MMIIDYIFTLYLISLTLSFFAGIIRFRKTDVPTKTIVVLLAITLVSEVTTYIFAKVYRNNMPVYHFFNPIEFILICLYFNNIISTFKKYGIGIYMAVAGLVMAVLNTLFVQPLDTLNSYFLLFEGFCVIFMSLYAYRNMFDDLLAVTTLNPHFWFSSIFLFLWGITYSHWAIRAFIGAAILDMMSIALIVVNIIATLSFGIVLLLFSKPVVR